MCNKCKANGCSCSGDGAVVSGVAPNPNGSNTMFWLVWNASTKNVYPTQYPNEKAATEEAQRLAANQLGQRLYVLAAVGTVKQEPITPPYVRLSPWASAPGAITFTSSRNGGYQQNHWWFY